MKQLVIKYLTDTISKEELKALQDWLQLPRNREYFKNAVRANSNVEITSPVTLELEDGTFQVSDTFKSTSYFEYQVETDKIIRV